MIKTLCFFSTILLLTVFLLSCSRELDKEYNWAYPVAGDWTLNAIAAGEHVHGPFEVKVYNSSFGKDSVWIDDYKGNFWSMKFKAKVDMNTLTFETAGSKNAISGYGINIKVMDGKVINNDSIYFNVEFADDPGTIYTLSGHRTTSYDEYMQD